MAQIKRIGFGQVEPNHLSAQRTAQIYAQLPAHTQNAEKSDAETIEILENGQFVKYDYLNNEVNFTGAGEWMLVFNEIKLYDDWRETYKDFAMIRSNYTPGSDTITHGGLGPFKGQMTPRVFKTNVGDIYTTNCVGAGNTSGKAVYEGIAISAGDLLKVNDKGFLVTGGNTETDDMVWQVVKVYTLADGQPAVKIMRVK